MDTQDQIINKVAQSDLITIDLEAWMPKGDRILFDLKPLLYMEWVLKEKEFREYVKNENWSTYAGKHVALTCTSEALIPTWAYMILTVRMQQAGALTVVCGDLNCLEQTLWDHALSHIAWESYKDKKIVVKGCSQSEIPVYAFVKLSAKLEPWCSSLMYGEPCSTVPVYKKQKS